MLILYSIFALCLFCWTEWSLFEARPKDMILYYTATVALLLLLAIMVSLIWSKNKQVKAGLFMCLALSNIGASIAFRMNLTDAARQQLIANDKVPILYSKVFFEDLLNLIIVFVIAYLLVRYTRIYEAKVLNILLAICLPIIPIVTRFTAEKINGSYLTLGGVMIFGIILAGYPFVAAYFLSRQEKRYLFHSVTSVSFNQLGLLLYTFLIYAGCMLCKEYGLLLILAITSTCLFVVRCKNKKTKMLYGLACAGGAWVAMHLVPHIQSRTQIWLQLEQAALNPNLKEKAESVLYLFRTIHRTGWWGNGMGSLSTKLYPTLNTDHVIVELIYEYSLLLAILVIVLGLALSKWMFKGLTVKKTYDYYLIFAGAIIITSIIVLDVASNLGSFITAGIGFPFISDGISVSAMVMILVAIRCAFYRKEQIR